MQLGLAISNASKFLSCLLARNCGVKGAGPRGREGRAAWQQGEPVAAGRRKGRKFRAENRERRRNKYGEQL
jgi:hypothetical protein